MKTMKVGALYCVQSDYRWLKYSIESIYPVVDKIFFLISDISWNGAKVKVDNSKTSEVIQDFPDPEEKIVVFRGEWEPEIAQRNCGLDLLKESGCDYALIIDADEVYETVQLKHAIYYAESMPQIPIWKCYWYTYWKEFYRIEPAEAYTPEILVKLVSEVRFSNIRDVQFNGSPTQYAVFPRQLIMLHHFSYSRTDEELLNKIATSSHKNQFLPGWFENVWKAWDTNKELENLHPCWPVAYKKAVKVTQEEMPECMKNILEK